MQLNIEQILIKMIKAIDLFKGISDKEALELAKDFKLNFYTKGSIIIKENIKLTKIYILKNGELSVHRSVGIGNNLLGLIGPGEVFGEMSYLTGRNTMAFVQAKTDCDVWEISIFNFDKFLNKYPHIKNEIMKIKYNREKMNESNVLVKKNENGNEIDSLDDIDDIKIII